MGEVVGVVVVGRGPAGFSLRVSVKFSLGESLTMVLAFSSMPSFIQDASIRYVPAATRTMKYPL